MERIILNNDFVKPLAGKFQQFAELIASKFQNGTRLKYEMVLDETAHGYILTVAQVEKQFKGPHYSGIRLSADFITTLQSTGLVRWIQGAEYYKGGSCTEIAFMSWEA